MKIKKIILIILVFILTSAFIGMFISQSDDGNTKVNSDSITGKTISIIGDSISTYEGVSNDINSNSTIGNNAVWYTSSKCELNDTYWMKTINDLNLELCVNNSWSGSECSDELDDVSSGCGTRAYNLHNDNKNIYPDIIVVYIGINDFYSIGSLGEYTSMDLIYDSSNNEYISDTNYFANAYAQMLHKIVKSYKNADIYCMTLLPIASKVDKELLEGYNNCIKLIANDLNCNIVDLYTDSGINQEDILTYTFDGTHPTVEGHEKIANCLKKELLKKYNK